MPGGGLFFRSGGSPPDGLSAHPSEANEAYFTSKVLAGAGPDGADLTVTPAMANQIYRFLVKNYYSDDDNHITDTFHQAKKKGVLAALPDDLKPHAEHIFQLIESVFSEGAIPDYENNRGR